MFFTADQLVLHALGDYVIQSDWMALEKTKKDLPALAHAASYTLPFLFLTTSWTALAFILATHFIIDRHRLARYVVWAKNFLAPRQTEGGRWWHPWSECEGTGYHKDRPAWMTVWLMIIADNLMHVTCNAVALRWFT